MHPGVTPEFQLRMALTRDSSKIFDKHVSMSTGSAGTFFIQKEDDNNLVITLPVLTPSEVITTSLMLDGKENPNINVHAKSKNSIAKAGSLIREQQTEDKKEVSRTLEILLPLIAILQIPVLLLLSTRLRRLLRKPLSPQGPRPSLAPRGLQLAREDLEHRVKAKPLVVVDVLIAKRQLVHPLPQQRVTTHVPPAKLDAADFYGPSSKQAAKPAISFTRTSVSRSRRRPPVYQR